MTDEKASAVGFRNTPVHTRFYKGGPQPQKRRKAKAGVDIVRILSEPLQVSDGPAVKKMHAYELGLISMANDAIKHGNMRKAERVLREFGKAGLFVAKVLEGAWPDRLSLPVDMDPDEWLANLKQFGPPPWPLPHDGLCRLEEMCDEHQRRRGR